MDICVNGICIHYESEGEGSPVILLHGNGEDHTIFDRLAGELSKEYEVFSLDTRGHGKSGEVGSFHYSDMVEDVAAFIRELRIEKPILYGFSDGGIVGLMLASKYPELLSGLIASGANLTPKGVKGTTRFLMRLAYVLKKDPLMKLMLDEPNITDGDLEKITVPVLITAAEKDIIPLSHTKHIFTKISDCRLVVVPKENHGSYVIHSDRLFPLISGFLKETAGQR